ncbi:acyltransferase [Shewanella sp. HL-SH2]|uniref:acyltransferase n=1 Tax=Shewanella sp. HL-SH2 TaxID=3436238 RepID=UPI003EBCD40F
MFSKLKYYILLELDMWFLHFLKCIPGFTGCFLRRFFFKLSGPQNFMIWDGVTIEYRGNLRLGNNVSINRGSVLNCAGGIDIGDNVLIGPRALIYSQNHNFISRSLLISEQGYSRSKVVIESDVWIAADVKIMPGVTIQKGSVIAAGSVVTKSTDEYGIYAGVPAKKISERQ